MRKLKMSACLFPSPDAGVLYIASRLSDIAADVFNDALDHGEVDDVHAALALLDSSFEDADEYGTALAAMDKLKFATDDSVDTFVAKWNKLNIKLGRDKNSRPAVTEFRNKLPPSISSKLFHLRPTAPLSEVVEQARWVEQNRAQFRSVHPRDQDASTQRAKLSTSSGARPPQTPAPASTSMPTSTIPRARSRIPPLTDALRREAFENDLCFRCRKPGHKIADCLARSPNRPAAPVAPKPKTTTVARVAEVDPESFDHAVTLDDSEN